MLQALGVAGGEDDVGPFGACPAGCFEADAGAAADQDDGLAEQLRLARGGRGSAHDSSDRLAICASIGVSGRGMSAISMRRAITAVS